MNRDTKMITSNEWISILGIILEVIGFILLLRYWHDPYHRHLATWIKAIKFFYPKSYEKKIKCDFNYWKDWRDKTKDSPDAEWLVPKGFAWYWHIMKLGSFFAFVVGLVLQLYQMFD